MRRIFIAIVFLCVGCILVKESANSAGWLPLATSSSLTADLNFSSNSLSGCASFSSCLTTTRALAETCIDASGNVTYAASNTPCITSSGLYVSGGGKNSNTQSQTFSTGSVNSAVLTASNAVAPDGTVNGAATLADNSSNDFHWLVPGGTLTPSSGQLVTFSVFVAPGTCVGSDLSCHYVQLLTGFHDSGSSHNVAVNFYLDNFSGGNRCAPGIPDTNTNSILDAGGQLIANNFCRVWVTLKTTDTTASTGVVVMINNIIAGRQPGYVGAGSTIIVWGAQTNAGPIIPYIPTTTSAVTLPADNIVAAGALKTALEGSAGRFVALTGSLRQDPTANGGFVQAAILGVGTTTMGLGRGLGNIEQTSWGTGTLKTSNQVERNAPAPVLIQQNGFGLSWDATGRALAINGGVTVSDGNSPSVVSSEQIGALSDQSLACECNIQRIRVWSTRNDVAMNSATVVSGTPSQLAPYTGAVGTRVGTHQSLSTTFRQIMSRARVRITENSACRTYIFANFYLSPSSSPGVEQGSGASQTITAGIEYPVGTFTQVKFSSSSSGTIPNNGIITSDPVCPVGGFTAWDYEFVRAFVTSSTGVVYDAFSGIEDAVNGEAMTIAASGLSDQTLGGTVTNTAVNQIYRPLAVVGTTVRPAICVTGDSYNNGDAQNSPLDAEGLMGVAPVIFGPRFGYINMAAGGDRVGLFPANDTNRIALSPYCTTMVSNYGINDAINAVSSGTLETSLQTFWALSGWSGKTKMQLTMGNDTTSTDGFATTANQTQVTGTATIITVNQWERGIPSGINFVFDTSTQWSSAQDSGKWLVNGAANFCTAAGLHPNSSCVSLVRGLQTIDLTKVQ